MAGELRCKAIRYKTALPLIQGGSATAGPMCAERCPRDYVCEPAVPNFKAHPVVGHKENGESIFRYIYTDIQKELTVKLRQSIEVYQSVELTEESRMALGQWLEQWLKNIAPNIRPSTLRRYEGTVRNHIVPFMGDKPITQITGKDIKKLYDTLARQGNRTTGEKQAVYVLVLRSGGEFKTRISLHFGEQPPVFVGCRVHRMVEPWLEAVDKPGGEGLQWNVFRLSRPFPAGHAMSAAVDMVHQLPAPPGVLVDLQRPVMGMRFEVPVSGTLEISPEGLLTGLVAGEQQVTVISEHHFQGCGPVAFFHCHMFLILHFGTCPDPFTCFSWRAVQPLLDLRSDPDGFPVHRRVAAEDDPVRSLVHPRVGMRGVVPAFVRQIQPEALFQYAPVRSVERDSFQDDALRRVVQYSPGRPVSSDIIGGVHQFLQLPPGLEGLQ